MIIKISGYDVIIDDEDFNIISGKKYNIDNATLLRSGHCYFLRNVKVDGKYTVSSLHRDIMGCKPRDGTVIDHINRNTLDCRKENMRFCTRAENSRNNKIRTDNVSGIKGVSWVKSSKRWQVVIKYNGKLIHCGTFKDIEDAKKSYENASIKYHKEFGSPSQKESSHVEA